MSAYHWDDLYDQAVGLFHGPAHPDTERQVLEHFQDNPARVAELIHAIGDDVKHGLVRSGWGIILKRLADLKAREHVVVKDTGDKAKATRNAEQWIRTAGLHFDRWPEVHDELFGDRGTLRAWRTDVQLTNRLETLWQEHRPQGEQVEADELERAERWLATREPKPTTSLKEVPTA